MDGKVLSMENNGHPFVDKRFIRRLSDCGRIERNNGLKMFVPYFRQAKSLNSNRKWYNRLSEAK
jgi:hypothetical protein